MNDEMFTMMKMDIDTHNAMRLAMQVNDVLYHGWRLARVDSVSADKVTMYFTKFTDE